MEKSCYIGKKYSVFTAELVAILIALYYIFNLPVLTVQVLVCVKSKSVLNTLESLNMRVTAETVIKINHIIHFVVVRAALSLIFAGYIHTVKFFITN